MICLSIASLPKRGRQDFSRRTLPNTAVLRCVRFFTAPLRSLSPTGLFFAITCCSRRAARLTNSAFVQGRNSAIFVKIDSLRRS